MFFEVAIVRPLVKRYIFRLLSFQPSTFSVSFHDYQIACHFFSEYFSMKFHRVRKILDKETGVPAF